MNKVLFTLMAGTLLACNAPNNTNMNTNTSNTAKNEEGWINLFDGKTTSGWHNYGKTTIGDAWKVTDNTLFFDASNKKDGKVVGGGDIVTNEEFENFHLKLDWKISPKGNSGIIFYIHETPDYPSPWQTGPEMQVLDNGTSPEGGHPDGKLHTHRAGDLYDLIASKEAVKPAGEWNAVEVISNNGKLDFYMNGQHTLSTTMWDDNWKNMIAKSKFKDMAGFGTYKKGKIGLQDHGDNVWFRNIRIKRL